MTMHVAPDNSCFIQHTHDRHHINDINSSVLFERSEYEEAVRFVFPLEQTAEDSRSKPEAKTHHAGAIPIQRRKELSRFVRQIYNRYSLRKQTARLSKSGQARVFGKFIAEQQKCKQREILGRNCARNLDEGDLHDLAISLVGCNQRLTEHRRN
jgi:hypothetical protein